MFLIASPTLVHPSVCLVPPLPLVFLLAGEDDHQTTENLHKIDEQVDAVPEGKENKNKQSVTTADFRKN